MKQVRLVSFVVPTRDEEMTLVTLYSGIKKNFKSGQMDFEIIFIDDGSSDSSWDVMKKLHKKDKRVKLIKHRGNFGKSIALQNGFDVASGEIIITMDADLQDEPKEIPRFIKKIEEGYDLVSGWKKIRYDPVSKTLPSKIGNWLARVLTGVNVHDLNCGFKAYRKEAVANLNLYGEMYKYIPVLAMKQNFKTTEIIVSHKKRKFGKSKFGWERNIKGILDLLTVSFLTGYGRRPGHFFGTFGIMSFAAGFCIGIYITYLRITTGGVAYRYPLIFLGMLLMIVGVQLISIGLIAEMLIYTKGKQDLSSTTSEKIL
jgi:glycosyltransferase involved in cell wall biosynthesis